MTTETCRYAFIVGHRKSGSTWLLNLLSLHPGIRGLMETSLFDLAWDEADPRRRTERLFTRTPWSRGGARGYLEHHLVLASKFLWKRAKPALALAPEDRPSLLPDLSFAEQRALRRGLERIAPPEAYCRHFFEFLRERLAPREYLLEKSPRNIHNVERIRRVFSGGKLIVIFRDGRDVVVSDQFFTRDYGHREWSFDEGVLGWRRDMEAHLSSAGRQPIFACSYEALLADGPAVVRELLDYLELPRDEALVADLVQRSSFRFYAGREPGQEDRKRFYRKGIVGDWKNHFTDEHKRIFKDLAGDLLITLGYEKDLSW